MCSNCGIEQKYLPVEVLWKLNKGRLKIDSFLTMKPGPDTETIKFWVAQFAAGQNTEIVINSERIVLDGNHRLVAARIAGVYSIGVTGC